MGMLFWDWFQTVAAVFVGNAFSAAVIFALAYLYRHENILKKPEESIPLWFYPLFLVPMCLMMVAVYTLNMD